MRIDPSIAERHWAEAAVEQVIERLRADGYEVEREASFGGVRADLVARRGGETLVYEFKAPSEGGEGWARAVALLRERAAEQGARFRLVFVRPPREARIEVNGIEAALVEALRGSPPKEFYALSPGANIEAVSDVEIDAIEVRPDRVAVEGEATVTASLSAGAGGTWATDSFPFAFGVVLDREARLKNVTKLEVDTSSWSGASDARAGAEDGGRSGYTPAESTAGNESS